MKTFLPRLACLVLMLGVCFLSRMQLVESRAESGRLHHQDAPNSLFSVLVFGGFRPLFLEYLWGRADALSAEGRWWEVSDVFDRIARLDPKNPRVWFNQSYSLAYNVAQFEGDDRERWRLYRRALDHLERGLEHNPDDWYLMELRFEIYFRHFAPDPFLSRHARMNLGVDGLEGALRSALAMRRAFPERLAAWDHERVAGEESAEWLMNRGQLIAAAEILEILAEHGEEARGQFPSQSELPRQIESWRDWARLLRRMAEVADWAALKNGAAPPAAAEKAMIDVLDAAAGLAAAPRRLKFDPEVELFDAAAYALIQFKGMELGQAYALSKMPSPALRLSTAVAKLARLPGGEIGPQMPYYTEAYVAAFQQLVEADQTLSSQSSDPSQPREEARARFLGAGDLVEGLVKERAGKTDGFVRRLRKSRLDG